VALFALFVLLQMLKNWKNIHVDLALLVWGPALLSTHAPLPPRICHAAGKYPVLTFRNSVVLSRYLPWRHCCEPLSFVMSCFYIQHTQHQQHGDQCHIICTFRCALRYKANDFGYGHQQNGLPSCVFQPDTSPLSTHPGRPSLIHHTHPD